MQKSEPFILKTHTRMQNLQLNNKGIFHKILAKECFYEKRSQIALLEHLLEEGISKLFEIITLVSILFIDLVTKEFFGFLAYKCNK